MSSSTIWDRSKRLLLDWLVSIIGFKVSSSYLIRENTLEVDWYDIWRRIELIHLRWRRKGEEESGVCFRFASHHITSHHFVHLTSYTTLFRNGRTTATYLWHWARQVRFTISLLPTFLLHDLFSFFFQSNRSDLELSSNKLFWLILSFENIRFFHYSFLFYLLCTSVS